MRSKIGFQRRNMRSRRAVRSVTKEHSKRKPANTELKKQHSALQGIINSAREPIFSVDRGYRYTGFNKAHASVMKTIYGKDIEIRGSLLDYMTVKEDREKAKQNIDRALTGEGFVEEAYSGEEALSRLYFEVSHSPITAKDGAIIGVAVFVKDITERTHMQKALKESEERYRLITENMAGSVWLMDMNLKPTYISPNNTRVRGYTLEELYALPLDRQLTPDSLKLALELFKKALSEQNLNSKDAPRSVTEELEFYRKDGSTFWSESTFSFVRNSKGEPVGILGVGRDITERKRAEEKLRQSVERYHSLFDRTLDGMYRSTHEGRFVDVNPAFVKMFGYSSKQEMLDITDIKKELYFSPEERGSHILDTGQEEVEVYRMRRKDGSEICVEDHGRYVHDEQGNIIYHEGILRDVTERVHAERALSESEERYRLLFEKSPVGVGLSTSDGSPTSANKTMLEITGYSLEELRKVKLADTFVGPQERTKLLQILDRDGSVTSFPAHLKRKDGTPYNALLSLSRLHVGGKDLVQTVCVDITSQMQMEEALRQHAKELEALHAIVLDITRRQDLPRTLRAIVERAAILLRTPSGGLYRCDPERQMVQCIVSYNTLKDYTGTVLKFGEGAAGTVASTGQPMIIDDYRSWSTRAGVFEQDQPFGALLSVPMIWEGQVTGVIHVLDKESRHFTEADLALLTLFANHAAIALENARYSENLEELVGERTRKLRESEEKYRELFEACPVSLWEQDFSAVKQFLGELRQKGVSDFGVYFANHPKDIVKCAALVKVLNVNEATLNLYNAKSVDEIIGGLSGVLTEESNRAFVGELVALAQDKKYYEGEMENRTLRGETKQCNVICAVVPGYEQSLAKVLVCIVDLTPQKKLEAELVKSQRLAAIGETAAMVGHDLRNPLQGIVGAAYNIRRHLPSAPDPSTKEMLAVIDNGVQYANGIINDLLEFSREMQLQLLPTTPKSLVRQTLTDVKIPNNITMEDTTADAPEILADEPKIKRVLANLIQNAIDAMPEGGRLSISNMNTQQEVSISVRDTGFGIPQDMMENIWTPLYTTKAKGIGLGLPICRRIIEAHGGTISVESTVGKGTTFTLKLPIQHVQTGGETL